MKMSSPRPKITSRSTWANLAVCTVKQAHQTSETTTGLTDKPE